jgi:Na+-translocating ferredoxin:NAD+ oxidoreductase RnfG subunit
LRKATGLTEQESPVILHWMRGPDGQLLGAYRVASEVGKYLPFEFLVALDGELAVKEVVVLNYREARGGQVQRTRFTGQFGGKTASSPIDLNRDIIGISGATLSAQAVTRGIKKTLWWAVRAFAVGEGRP